MIRLFLPVAFAALVATTALAQTNSTIEDFNASLLPVGVSWRGAYLPSFYTGFAPRIDEANRIHFRLGRGNQARLTAPLDEYAILTYVYGLKKRAEAVDMLVRSGDVSLAYQKQFAAYKSILASEQYQIPQLVERFERGAITREQFYEASLALLKKLNPSRVFDIRVDMKARAIDWRQSELKGLAQATQANGQLSRETALAYINKNLRSSLVVVNNLLFGRINATNLTEAQKKMFAELIVSAMSSPVTDEAFTTQTVAFFHSVTANRYSFRVSEAGQFRSALVCGSVGRCELAYAEFTAIYPVGSVKAQTRDRDGNEIWRIQEVGVLNFIDRSYHDTDHIRTEQHYGWVPKMDYTMDGNGIHNPAVRTWLPGGKYKWLYKQFGIPKTDDTMWIVSRGGVTHGCTRLAAGHILEVRNIFPSNPQKIKDVLYTGNHSADYDLFDIDGDGKIEVMGVDFLVAYALAGDSGAGYREGNGFIDQALKRDPFYEFLYGRSNQYKISSGKYVFVNPYVSYFSGDPRKRAIAYSVQMRGEFELYEQKYEQDKIQFFNIPKLGVSMLTENKNNKSNQAAQLVRVFGRAAGCGPFSAEIPGCFEKQFESELRMLSGSRR